MGTPAKIAVSLVAWLFCTIVANAFMEVVLKFRPSPIENTAATLALLVPLLFVIWKRPSLVRVVVGFALACLAAGITTALFVTTPAEIATTAGEALPDKLKESLFLALLAATHIAIFAGAFALIATSLAEWRGWRWLLYYLLTGAVIALLGFYAQYASEIAGQPSILNSYAATAFVSAGLTAGFVYWLVSGRFAGGTQREGWDPVPATNPSRPRIIVETRPETERPKRPASLAERVAKAEAAAKPAAADDDTPNSA